MLASRLLLALQLGGLRSFAPFGRRGARPRTAFVLPMLFTLALCILITSKNGSRFNVPAGAGCSGHVFRGGYSQAILDRVGDRR